MDYEKAWNDLKFKIADTKDYYNKLIRQNNGSMSINTLESKNSTIDLIQQYIFDIEIEQE